MRSSSRATLDGVYDFLERKSRARQARIKAHRRKEIVGFSQDFKQQYEELVVPYWRQFGQRPGLVWYQLLAAHTGVVDPRYIPEDIYFDYIIPYYCNSQFRRALEDKGMYDWWFSDVNRPSTVVVNNGGIFFDEKGRFMDKQAAISACLASDRTIVKPTIDSGEARLIRLIESQHESRVSVEQLFSTFGSNFIVQDVQKQHPILQSLNASSLNTLRIVTFLAADQVHVLSSIVRMGAAGSPVDNVGAGGLACGVNSDGRLMTQGVNRRSEWTTTAPSGVTLAQVSIPGFSKALDLASKLHTRLPHFKIIGWDLAIDPDAQPVLIEYNTAPGQNQYSCGPTFGDITDSVLTDVFLTKTLSSAQN